MLYIVDDMNCLQSDSIYTPLEVRHLLPLPSYSSIMNATLLYFTHRHYYAPVVLMRRRDLAKFYQYYDFNSHELCIRSKQMISAHLCVFLDATRCKKRCLNFLIPNFHVEILSC